MMGVDAYKFAFASPFRMKVHFQGEHHQLKVCFWGDEPGTRVRIRENTSSQQSTPVHYITHAHSSYVLHLLLILMYTQDSRDTQYMHLGWFEIKLKCHIIQIRNNDPDLPSLELPLLPFFAKVISILSPQRVASCEKVHPHCLSYRNLLFHFNFVANRDASPSSVDLI